MLKQKTVIGAKMVCWAITSTLIAILLKYALFYASVCIDKNTVNDSEINIPIYIINLDRAKDRMVLVDDLMKLYDLKYERFSAADWKELIAENEKNGQKLKIDALVNNDFEDKEYTVSCSKYPQVMIKIFKKYYNEGEIGCLFSHIAVWDTKLRKGLNQIIVFEDDVIFKPFFRNRLKKILKQLPKDYDIVFLGYWSNYSVGSFSLANNVVEEARGTYMSCLHAYIINLRSKEFRVFQNVRNIIPIDIEIHALINSAILKAYLSGKCFVAQNRGIESNVNILGKARYQSISDYNKYTKEAVEFLTGNIKKEAR